MVKDVFTREEKIAIIQMVDKSKTRAQAEAILDSFDARTAAREVEKRWGA